MLKKHYFVIFLLIVVIFLRGFQIFASLPINNNNKIYIIEDIKVLGNEKIDDDVIIGISGLKKGEIISIPGIEINSAINKIWKQKIIDDVSISAKILKQDKISLIINIKEKPIVTNYYFKGVNNNDKEAIFERIGEIQGRVLTDFYIKNVKIAIVNYYKKKGYYFAEVNISKTKDKNIKNGVVLNINVKKNRKAKIHKIHIRGNNLFTLIDIKRKMIMTKERTRANLFRRICKDIILFKPFYKKKQLRNKIRKSFFIDEVSGIIANFTGSSFQEEKFNIDKQKFLTELYYDKGYLDARILKTELKKYGKQNYDLYLDISEGSQYKIGNIRWIGNTKFSDDELNKIIDCKYGEIYNKSFIEKKLFAPLGSIHALYKNSGYLFSTIEVKRSKIENNIIDLDIYVHEDEQAIIEDIIITGNLMTKDHVIRRYLNTIPGDKYSNIAVLQSRDRLAKTGFIDEKKLQIIPLPNYDNKTTDIEVIVKEKLDLKASLTASVGIYGWQGGFNIGLNNFSLINLLKFKIPLGDAQMINLSWEKSAKHSKWGFSFYDPWIGGTKPWQFRIGFNYSTQSNKIKQKIIKNNDPMASVDYFGDKNPKKEKEFKTNLTSIGFDIDMGKVLFSYTNILWGISYIRHNFKNFNIVKKDKRYSGKLDEIILNLGIEYDSTNSYFYPTKGQNIHIKNYFTPPWSLFSDKYKNPKKIVNSFSEFQQWMCGASFVQKIVGNLVVFGKMQYGFLSGYTKEYGIGPYKRFIMGGDGMIGDLYNPLLSQTPIKLRGYSNPSGGSFGMPENSKGYIGGVLFNKFTFELRHPISLKFIIPIYLHMFFEAGNTWAEYQNYNFKDIIKYKSYGIGIRTIIPMLGPLGIDIAFGLNRPKKQLNPEIHFSLGQFAK